MGTSLKNWLHGLIAAIQFLSRLPMPINIPYNNDVFRRSVPFYPLVGVILSLILTLFSSLIVDILPILPVVIIILVIWVTLTGGLHLDGLMDTADGILSHRPRELMLEIMKDSRVGAMGVIVCVLHLMMKAALLATILPLGWRMTCAALALSLIWSRCFMAIAMKGWPYARKESGLGSYFQGTPILYVWMTVGIACSISAVLWFTLSNQLVDNNAYTFILIPATILTAGWLIAAYLNRKLGGLTGDTYGALIELLEMVGLLVAVVLFY
ncbi:adenosylcobinamide-GDP ribazoletransferase [Paenibacillus sp. N1-5-1-14]|uniref:adenosylcobinamide-GDP ribazoletransferase n=1 Tax=Paenibacillus radicibacter TaxID=2972488 RepID=UPI002159B347|nr:adenosylcobinamide-GDP ribazoletransferase [Paenibacillus radicibacter]MCR8644893.1 adenosylcobinamide-GDP ribazoletransferase [Paenibacillus radicibacter]